MTPFEKMQLRESSFGNTIRNEKINNSRQLINALLPDDPSYKENVEILGKGLINLRMNNYKLVQGTTPQMDIQASIDENITFGLGDVFFYDDGYWLCVENNNRHGAERTGKVEECNYLLKWQNPKTLEIISRWCSVRDPYSSGLDESKVISTGSAKYRIKLPSDNETELFHVDRRFLIDVANNEPIPYAIVKYDSITNRYAARNEGFLVITLRESQIQDDDNWELMIANYQDPSRSPNIPDIISGSCAIKYNGTSKIKAGGSAKSFYAEFYDNKGNALHSITPIWNVDLSADKITVVSQVENEIKLKADAKANIGSDFVLQIEANDLTYGHFKAALRIEIEGLF